jgi:DNA-binding NarL/FixJ family response regulator
MIRILIADDHTIIREGLKQILSDTPDITVVDEAVNGQEVLEKIEKKDFDMLLLDISMPGRDGIEILKELKRQGHELPVLILSMYSEEQYAVRALRAGAFGYLSKESAPEELIGAIRKVSQGRKYVTSTLAEKMAVDLDADAKRPLHERLSDRELQVMRLIALGKSVKEIADDLSLSVKTISTYRARILEKLHLKNNLDVIRYAIENRLTG